MTATLFHLLGAITMAPKAGSSPTPAPGPAALPPSGAMPIPISPSTLPGAGGPKLPEIRDIAPPVDVFPYTWWQVTLAVLVALLLLAVLAWIIIEMWPRNQMPPPKPPRTLALAALENLRVQARTLNPYAFSIAVSDVLREFVEGQYRVHAREQTSPEFLAAIATAPGFTTADRKLLADFLGQCDLLKFARVEADASANEALLASAGTFVQGGRAA